MIWLLKYMQIIGFFKWIICLNMTVITNYKSICRNNIAQWATSIQFRQNFLYVYCITKHYEKDFLNRIKNLKSYAQIYNFFSKCMIFLEYKTKKYFFWGRFFVFIWWIINQISNYLVHLQLIGKKFKVI